MKTMNEDEMTRVADVLTKAMKDRGEIFLWLRNETATPLLADDVFFSFCDAYVEQIGIGMQYKMNFADATEWAAEEITRQLIFCPSAANLPPLSTRGLRNGKDGFRLGVDFARTYGAWIRKLGEVIEKWKEWDYFGDTYSDFVDSIPLMGRDLVTAIMEGKVRSTEETKAFLEKGGETYTVKEWQLRGALLGRECYFRSKIWDSLEQRFHRVFASPTED